MYCISYEIKQGDSLYSVSKRFHVNVEMILNANPMANLYNLQVGQIICIPVSMPHNYTHYTTYLVHEGDTLGSVLDEYDINMSDFMDFNDLNNIELNPGSTLQIPMEGEGER